jgi:hypothetical protein
MTNSLISTINLPLSKSYNMPLFIGFSRYFNADGQFDSPHGIAIDSSNNVCVSDTYNHRIQVFVLDP